MPSKIGNEVVLNGLFSTGNSPVELPNGNIVFSYGGSNSYTQLISRDGKLIGGAIPGAFTGILPNGNFLVSTFTLTPSDQTQIVSSDGTLIGNPIQGRSGGIASNGNFIVVYQVSSNYYAQVVSPAGTLVGNTISVGNYNFPGIKVLSGRSFVLTYKSGATFYAQVVGNDGILIGNTIQTGTSYSRVTTLLNGNFVLTYQNGSNYYAQLVTANGALVGSVITNNNSTLPFNYGSVTILPNGNFALNYQNGTINTQYTQFVNSNAMLVRNLTQGSVIADSVTNLAKALPNGNFILSYHNFGLNDFVQLVDSNEALVGSTIQASFRTTLSNGNFVVYNISGYSQVISDNGTLVGSVIQGIVETTLSNGNFLVLKGGTTTQIVSINGALIGSAVQGGFQASLPNGGLLVSYSNSTGGSTNDYVQIVGANGALVGAAVGGNLGTLSGITVLPNGNFVAMFNYWNGTKNAYYTQVVNSSGALLGSVIPGAGSSFSSSMITSSNGDFIEVFYDWDGTKYTYYTQVINSSGALIGNLTQLTTTPSIIALPSGNFVITYQNNQGYHSQFFAINTVPAEITMLTESLVKLGAILLPNNYLVTLSQTAQLNTYLQIFYTGANLTITPVNQQLDYLQDVSNVDLNEITILTEANVANATLILSDSQAGKLTVPKLGNNATVSFDSQQGVWNAFGDVNDVNAVLNQIQFIPSPNYESNFTISLHVVDEWNRTVGGVLTMIGIPTPPVLMNNVLNITQGQSVVLSNSNLQVNPITRPVTFSVSSVQGGYFEFVNDTSKHITEFTQQQINSNQVRFVSDRSAPVSYEVGMNDGQFTVPSVVANVTFTNHPPKIVNAPTAQLITVNQPFQFDFVTNQTIIDPDGDPLIFSASSSDGTALPDWIRFDASQVNQLDFSGKAPSIGRVGLSLFATDPLNASTRSDFEVIATNDTSLNAAGNGQIVGGVVGGVLGFGALIGAGLGFWRYATDKRTRQGEHFADYIRESLNLKGVNNFEANETGQQYVASVHNLAQALQQAGISTKGMRQLELRQLADDVADAARNKISPATDCLGRSVITVTDLSNKIQELVTEVQVLRNAGRHHTI